MKLKGIEKPPQCEHVKTNGLRCGSPAVSDRKFCYFHQRARDLHHLRRQRPQMKLYLPLLEDANAIQMAIQQVAEAIADERIDNKRAGLLLFAFQTAACNLKNVSFEPGKLRQASDDSGQLTPVIELLAKELGLLEEEILDEENEEIRGQPAAGAEPSTAARKPPTAAPPPETAARASGG